MSDKYEPAFPITSKPLHCGELANGTCKGISIRDYFAAKAMQAILIARLANKNGTIGVNNFEHQVAEDAETMANAMLKQRKANER